MTNVFVDGERVQYDRLPEFCRDIVRRYVESGIHPGTGWEYILTGNLTAALYVDDETRAALPDILRWLHNSAPPGCHGSMKNFREWREARAMEAADVA